MTFTRIVLSIPLAVALAFTLLAYRVRRLLHEDSDRVGTAHIASMVVIAGVIAAYAWVTGEAPPYWVVGALVAAQLAESAAYLVIIARRRGQTLRQAYGWLLHREGGETDG